MCPCSSDLWKVEFVRNEIEYLTEDISKWSVEGTLWFLLSAYSKMWEERSSLKTELLSKKELEHKFRNTYPIHIAEKEKAHSEENVRNKAKQLFDKEIKMGVNKA